MRVILALEFLCHLAHPASAGASKGEVIADGSGPVPGALVCPNRAAAYPLAMIARSCWTRFGWLSPSCWSKAHRAG